MQSVKDNVTHLLQQVTAGNREAVDQLIPLVYDQLHKMASHAMSSERPGHTLRATALVHEAYLRLVDSSLEWQDRRHFYAVAAKIMRRILVDYARSSGRQKRGGGVGRVSLDDAVLVSPNPQPQIVELDEALDRLASFDQRKATIIEMLYFGGFSWDEVAQVLDISQSTLHRELVLAKAWLLRDLTQPIP